MNTRICKSHLTLVKRCLSHLIVSCFRQGRLPSTKGLIWKCVSGSWNWLRNFNARSWSVGDAIGWVSVPSKSASRVSSLGKWLHSASTLMLEIHITHFLVAYCCIWCMQGVRDVKYYKLSIVICICILNALRICVCCNQNLQSCADLVRTTYTQCGSETFINSETIKFYNNKHSYSFANVFSTCLILTDRVLPSWRRRLSYMCITHSAHMSCGECSPYICEAVKRRNIICLSCCRDLQSSRSPSLMSLYQSDLRRSSLSLLRSRCFSLSEGIENVLLSLKFSLTERQ